MSETKAVLSFSKDLSVGFQTFYHGSCPQTWNRNLPTWCNLLLYRMLILEIAEGTGVPPSRLRPTIFPQWSALMLYLVRSSEFRRKTKPCLNADKSLFTVLQLRKRKLRSEFYLTSNGLVSYKQKYLISLLKYAKINRVYSKAVDCYVRT